MAKALKPDLTAATMDAVEYNVTFGPRYFRVENVPGYIVPIQPRYHAMLFPEAEVQLPLMASSHPFGNSIRKAYLCHSNLRRLAPGAFLLFYRSQDVRAVCVLGVVEDTIVSDEAREIARFVGKRTVYSFNEIEQMAAKPVLGVLFRQSRLLDRPWPLDLLKRSGIVNGPPQSFAAIPESAQRWLIHQLHG